MRKFVAVVLLLCMLLNCACACASGLTFAWWGGDARHQATRDAVSAYMSINPDVWFTMDYGPWNGWEEKITSALMDGRAADINQVNWNWLRSERTQGAFVDLNEYADVIDLSQFDPEALNACTVDGQLLGLPVSVTGRIFYWNTETFQAAGMEYPHNFADLMYAGELFRQNLGEDYYPLVLNAYDRMIFMVYYLESLYGHPWIENGRLQYGAAEIAEALQLIQEMEYAHVIPTMEVMQQEPAPSLDKDPRWQDGRFAGILEWDSSAANFQAALHNPGAFTVGEFFADLGDHQGGFTKVSLAFAISATAADPFECARFLNFLLNEEEGAMRMNTQRGMPLSLAGAEYCRMADLLDPLVAEANARVLAWCAFDMDPYFEDAALRAEPDGVYVRVHQGLSRGDYTPHEAAEELIAGIQVMLPQ